MNVSFAVRELKDELQYLLEPASHIGEVVKAMGRDKVLVKVSDVLNYIIMHIG